MLPIRDHDPSSSYPIINNLIIGSNIILFIYTLFLSPSELNQFINTFAFTPANFNYLNLITAQFIHGSIGHILGNMLFLHIFGENIEGVLGHFKYLAYYLFCGVIAVFTQYLISPNSSIPILGASGAIAGVMGGYLILFPKAKIDIIIPAVTISASTLLIYWVGAQFIQGFGSLNIEGGGVAYFAHIGGFVAGILLIHLFPKRKNNQFV